MGASPGGHRGADHRAPAHDMSSARRDERSAPAREPFRQWHVSGTTLHVQDDPDSMVDDGEPFVPGGARERLVRKRAEEAARLEQLKAEQQEEEAALGRQRRQNVRVDVQLPITIRMSGREAPGRTRDVSATGIGFSTRLPVELDQRGEVTVEFDGWRFRKAFIVRFCKPILAGTQLGVQFDELTEEERERLVRQVFDIQRAQLRDQTRAR